MPSTVQIDLRVRKNVDHPLANEQSDAYAAGESISYGLLKSGAGSEPAPFNFLGSLVMCRYKLLSWLHRRMGEFISRIDGTNLLRLWVIQRQLHLSGP